MQDPRGIIVELYQTFKEDIISILHKTSRKEIRKSFIRPLLSYYQYDMIAKRKTSD